MQNVQITSVRPVLRGLKAVKTTQHVSDMTSIRLGCIFSVVQMLSAFLMLIKIAPLNTVPSSFSERKK